MVAFAHYRRSSVIRFDCRVVQWNRYCAIYLHNFLAETMETIIRRDTMLR
jgi:hypothetical protein